MSTTPPPEDPWGSSGGYPPPPPGEYPPPPPGGGYPPPGGNPPPPPGGGYPGGGYPGGGYPGGGYPPPGGYPGGGYPPPGGYYGGKGLTPFGPASGWWRRLGATLIDWLVLIVPIVIVDVAGGRFGGGILGIVLQAAYMTILLSRSGQTVGNMALGTRVVDARTGGPLTTGRALGRWATVFISGVLLVLLIPFLLDILWPLWDGQNQTLHDKMAGTLVLRTN